MFHWICPECGREIPPSVKECPACDPQAAIAVAALEPAAPLPLPVASLPPIPVLSIEAEPPLDPLLSLAESIRAAQVPAIEPVKQPPLQEPSKPEVPVETVAVHRETGENSEVPTELEAVEVSTAGNERQPEESPGVALEAPASVVLRIAPVPANVDANEATAGRPSEPLLIAEAPQAVALLAPPPVPEPLSQEDIKTEEFPIFSLLKTAPAQATAPEAAVPELAAPQPAANLIPESIKIEPTAPPAHQPGPPLALDLAASTAELPTEERPPSGSWLQLAGLQDYRPAARRAMRPAVPPAKILMPDSGPRITLPGPALPPELNSLREANVTVIRGEARRQQRRLPGWAVSLLFVIAIPAFGAALLFYFMPLGRSNAETKPAAPQEPQTSIVQASSHPLAQYVEVTGFRIVADLSKKSEIHYLVVNHSAAELADMTVYVTLRTADAKPGQPPLCRFSFRAPSLAAFESKEMTSPIEKLARPVALPEWQDLRPEVQIAQ